MQGVWVFVVCFRFVCLYPVYINSKKTLAEGRRIPTEKVCNVRKQQKKLLKQLTVSTPTLKWDRKICSSKFTGETLVWGQLYLYKPVSVIINTLKMNLSFFETKTQKFHINSSCWSSVQMNEWRQLIRNDQIYLSVSAVNYELCVTKASFIFSSWLIGNTGNKICAVTRFLTLINVYKNERLGSRSRRVLSLTLFRVKQTDVNSSSANTQKQKANFDIYKWSWNSLRHESVTAAV